MLHPSPPLLVFRTLLVGLVALAGVPCFAADAWSGPGVRIEVDPGNPQAVVVTVNAERVSGTSAASADGSLRGHLQVGSDRHAWTLSAAGRGGQRTFGLGGQSVVVEPFGGGAATPKPLDPAPARAALRLKVHTLRDPGVGNMPSHTVLVPEGWKVEGGAWWIGSPGAFNVLPSHDVSVTSPEGAKVDLSPEVGFKFFEANAALGMPPQRVGQTDGGYPVMPMPQGPEAWRRWLADTGVPASEPTATHIVVTEVAVVPEFQPLMNQLVGPLKQNVAMENQRTRQMGLPGGGGADGCFYAAHITFERDGRQWEQLSVFGVFWLQSRFEVGRQWWWSVLPGRTFTVPRGELARHLPVLVAVADSLKATPQWAQMKHQHAMKLSGISARGAAQRAEITRRGMEKVRQINRETSDIIANTYDPNAGEALHRKVINALTEVEDYAATDGTTVQLPAGYERVYRNGDDEFLMTNDHLLSPDPTVWTPVAPPQ